MRFGKFWESSFGIRVTPGSCRSSETIEFGEAFAEGMFLGELFSDSGDVVGAKIREPFVQAHGTCEFFYGLLGVECCQVREIREEALDAGDVPFGSSQESQDERGGHRRGNISR